MKREATEMKDIEICKLKIEEILREYNCRITSDDYSSAWLEDIDTGETASIE